MKAIVPRALVALLAVSCGGHDASQAIDEIKAGIEHKHPSEYYRLAGELFSSGNADEAVFWFYAGQLRYRYHLLTERNLDPSGDPALFASLSEVLGRPINEYAFGDVPKLAATIDEVLAWDQSQENGFTPKSRAPQKHQEVRAGLEEMKAYILANQAEIAAQRRAAGLR